MLRGLLSSLSITQPSARGSFFRRACRRTLFQTGWFVESLLSQTLIVHVIRTSRVPFLESRPSAALIAMTISVAAVGIALPFSPLGSALGLKALPPAYWGVLAALLAAYLVLTQLVKNWVTRRFGLD